MAAVKYNRPMLPDREHPSHFQGIPLFTEDDHIPSNALVYKTGPIMIPDFEFQLRLDFDKDPKKFKGISGKTYAFDGKTLRQVAIQSALRNGMFSLSPEAENTSQINELVLSMYIPQIDLVLECDMEWDFIKRNGSRLTALQFQPPQPMGNIDSRSAFLFVTPNESMLRQFLFSPRGTFKPRT